jgi:hypothetical protein
MKNHVWIKPRHELDEKKRIWKEWRIIMSKKLIKSKFEAADIMNKLMVLPTLNAVRDEGMDLTPIKDYIKDNETDLATLDKYFKDIASAYNASHTIANPPKDIETKINYLVTQLKEVINNNYPRVSMKLSVYDGITAYYKSDGTADFLENDNVYFGHCIAFDKYVTKIICEMLGLGLDFGAFLIYLWLKIHLPKLADPIYDALKDLIDLIKGDLDKYKNNQTGIIFFYFDRVDKVSKIFDHSEIRLQPAGKWVPGDYYPQADWIKVFP